ncbi:hypothetical protein B0H34DRAFT_250874 [Crassisporium funariophilum]|nr:hypothetical protein B0H34DRAFT_250874 [Crassisporium funariophilum]
MLANPETPRPLPPAKARRAALLKSSSTPPPAYGSPFTFPSRQARQEILGSPMSATFHMVGWDARPAEPSSPAPIGDEVDRMNDKSREELEELLNKAGDIMKKRENDLGVASAMCKDLYKDNVALKSKHQALLARIQMSPTRSTSSPGALSDMLHGGDSMTMTYSNSDSALGLISSPRPSFVRGHTRKVSVSTADISLLADQNAELLDKLEKLEEETTTTDQAGRRELKRLEKEIAFLREALEKTQAKSEELEEKVHGAVVGEAWRKKKEREEKFRAMRNLGRETNQEGDDGVRNFAPEGSKFGGPSDGFTFFPTAESPDPRRGLPIRESTSDMELDLAGLFPHPEHALISQLLVKVQELEDTNTRILKQQTETATQLSAVKRDTDHITKVYECLADPNTVELELETDGNEERKVSSTQTIKFRSLRRDIDSQFLSEGHIIPDFTVATKNRKTVMGLFDDDNPISTYPTSQSDNPPTPFEASPWTDSYRSRLSWQSTEQRGLESPGALSPLHFFSPPTQILQELSPLGSRPTLLSELDKELGDTWDTGMNKNNHHLRTSSLYDLSQFSVPPSPSPTSRALSRRASDELDFEAHRKGGLCTPLPMSAGLLRLSVEPPTPVKMVPRTDNTRSPRVQRMSDTLRSRTGRWVDRRFKEGRPQSAKAAAMESKKSRLAAEEDANLGFQKRLSNSINAMVEKFDSLSMNDKTNSRSRSTSGVEVAPLSPLNLPQDNALQLRIAHSPEKVRMRQKNAFGAILLELWLWLQFAIIIFVFVYTMAKRGPKVVLVDAEQKRTIARSR